MLISTYCTPPEDDTQTHPVVSQEQWLAARKTLLLKEKEFTHLRDEINRERLALPWVKIEKNYVFDTPKGKKTLSDLFDGRSQLIVYHFMLGPGWEAGCPGCSFLSDHIDGALPHLEHHDVTWTAVSRAPLAEIEAYKKPMSFGLPRVSSLRNGRQLRLPRFVHQRRSGNRQGPLQLRRNACAERIAGTE